MFVNHYQQVQSFSTPWLWWRPTPKKITELANATISLDSLVAILPLTRTVTEDFPPTAAYALVNVNVNTPLPLNRAVSEDFPPMAGYSLDSVLQIAPILRTVSEDFPPMVGYSLDSVLIVTPVNRTINDDFPPNASYSLQSVIA